MTPYKQNPVSQVAWAWCAGSEPVPDMLRSLRRRALTQAVVVAGLGLGVRYIRGPKTFSMVLFVVACMLGLSGLLMPRVYSAAVRAGKLLARGVGVAVTWVVLPPVFYLVFLPGRLILSRCGKGSLQLHRAANEPTYWVGRSCVTHPDRERKPY